MKQRFDAGKYYGITRGGRVLPLDAPDGTLPDVVVARRVADFPGRQVPPGGTVIPCATCGAPLVTNLQKFPGVPRRCMQCEGVIPEPMPEDGGRS